MEDVRSSRINEIYSALFRYGRRHRDSLEMVGCEVEDFVQDVVLNIFSRKGLDKWDDCKTKAGFEAVIFSIAEREMIDKKRAKFGAKSRQYEGRPVQMISISTPLGDEEGSATLGDMLEADGDLRWTLGELMDRCPETRISPRYLLTWKQLLVRSMSEDAKDIAHSVGISESRIEGLQLELSRMLRV